MFPTLLWSLVCFALQNCQANRIANITGVLWLIQVYDRRCSWCPSLSLSRIGWGRWQSWCSWCVLAHPGVWSPVFLVASVFPFPGSVEAGGYGKAGVTGTFFLIQVHDRRCSWCLQSFPFHDWLRSVAKLVFLVCFGSSRCMIAGVPGGLSLSLSRISWGRWLW